LKNRIIGYRIDSNGPFSFLCPPFVTPHFHLK
jgi:hypothetical protein